MTNKNLTLKEMIDFLKELSANDSHETCISIVKNKGAVKEINSTSKFKIIDSEIHIKLKAELGRRFVSFIKSEIEKIAFEVFDFKMKLAHLIIEDNKKTVFVMVDTSALESLPF